MSYGELFLLIAGLLFLVGFIYVGAFLKNNFEDSKEKEKREKEILEFKNELLKLEKCFQGKQEFDPELIKEFHKALLKFYSY